MNYEDAFSHDLEVIEKKLDELLPVQTQNPGKIHEAMRYSIFPRGKRFRPILTLSVAEALGGSIEDALIPALSIELIHGYSLVHDDLPALDNDDMRRGNPSCHKQYGEAMAILAGDGLLTLAFQILTQVRPVERLTSILDEISTAAGTYGMIGGQVADLITPKQDLNLPMLDYISIHKTGKLIKASTVCGALASNASEEDLAHMTKFGELLGLAFQSIDDLLDEDGYSGLLKPVAIKSKVRDLIAQAKKEIKPYGPKAAKLQLIVDFLLERMSKKDHVEMDR